MQRRLKTPQVFLFIAVLFLVVGFSAYFYCCNLAKPEFLSADLSLENPEEDDTGINHLYELKIPRLNVCLGVPLLLIKNISRQSSLIDFLKPCPEQETIMLRC